jgi:hypothetical protein
MINIMGGNTTITRPCLPTVHISDVIDILYVVTANMANNSFFRSTYYFLTQIPFCYDETFCIMVDHNL